MFAGTGVRLRLARVEAVDVERKAVTLDDGEIGYDTLLYTLGSAVAEHGRFATLATCPPENAPCHPKSKQSS